MSDNEPSDVHGSEDPFNENVEPGTGPVIKADEPTHLDTTRRNLAYAAMALLIVLAVGGLGGWIVVVALGRTASYVQTFGIIMSPIVALLGPILGFYFSKSND